MQIQIDKFTRSKRRTIALIIERDGTLTVRAPMRATKAMIGQFLQRDKSALQSALCLAEQFLYFRQILRDFIQRSGFRQTSQHFKLHFLHPNGNVSAARFDAAKDTAEILNLTETNVKTRLLHARMFLREKLSTYYSERQKEKP